MAKAEPFSLTVFFTPPVWEVLSKQMNLSEREVQIIQGLLDNKKEMDIAREMEISPHTVRTHLARMHGKLGVSSRAALVNFVLGEFLRTTAQADSPLPPICGKRTNRDCPRNR